MTAPNGGRLCFVVTRNHGSLIDTMVFLHGTKLLERSVILLPPELFATHQTGLDATVREYRSLADLRQAIEVEQPSMVFLFSGYLLSSTGLLSQPELKRFLRLLDDRGCLTITNDPCWGLFTSRFRMSSELPGHTLAQKVHRAFVEWLIPHRLRQSYRTLRGLVHCYPAPVEPTIPPEQLRTAAYFNTRLLGSFGLNGSAHAGSHHGWSRPMDGPYWLFILASLDYEIQVNLHGKTAYIESLMARMRDATLAGRHAVLIAPGACLAAIKEVGGVGDATLIGFCEYPRYVALLMFAEYAFYWNIGSSSNLYRLFNGLPVIYFDRGHVSRWFPAFFDRTVELLYRGHMPAILDHRDPLTPDRLQSVAGAFRESADDIVRQLRMLPEPEEFVALLEGEPSASRA